MKNLTKILPWDISLTSGGFVTMIMIIANEFLAIYWMLFQPQFSDVLAVVSISLPAILLLWFLFLGATERSRLWSHFVGTDVICRDYEHRSKILSWACHNHDNSHEFTDRIKVDKKEYTVRFLHRDKAILAKLSVK